MALFKTGPDIRATFRAAKESVEALESMSAFDVAQSLPFVKITRMDPTTTQRREDIVSINAFFQKPPSFGNSVDGVLTNRPTVSFESLNITTKQNYGTIMEEHVELKLTAHRPDMIFEGDDSAWRSIITPGVPHIIEYGWKSSSNHPLLNGEASDGNFISRRSIIFVPAIYQFNILQNGEIKFTIKGYNSATLAVRTIYVTDIEGVHVSVNELEKEKGKVPKRQIANKRIGREIIKSLQQKLNNIDKINKRGFNGSFVRLGDVLNDLFAGTITTFSKKWGYTDADLGIANFNDKVGSTRKKYGSVNMSGKSIADFLIPTKELTKWLNNFVFNKDNPPTLYNLLETIVGFCNNKDVWDLKTKRDDEGDLVAQRPIVKTKVTERVSRGKRFFVVVVFDEFAERIKFDANSKIPRKEQNRNKIKRAVLDADIPFISLGKGFSYIKDAQFNAIMDQDIQRNKIIQSAGRSPTREEYVKKTGSASRDGLPEPFHEIFASAVEGTIPMIGNFIFDTFALVWVDMRNDAWSGTYVVTERVDMVTNEGFTTTMKVNSDGGDPLNTRRKLSKQELEEKAVEKQALRDEARAKANRRKSNRARTRRNAPSRGTKKTD